MSRRDRLLFAGLLVSFSACTYQWPVGSASFDAATDAPTDASLVDRPGTDAIADVRVDAPPPVDAGPDTAPNCPAFQAAVVAARGPAKKCQQGISFCGVKLKDQCDCDTYVDDASAQNVITYTNAIAAWKASKCTLPCPPAGGCSGVAPGCLVDPDAGFATFCFP